ncbi:MAG: zinc ribbon domain-containing protein [Defluviitaleaceae bacterium]|nr:zinc ribbon domain-containing protein [Defluviitaleaceae bacterium]
MPNYDLRCPHCEKDYRLSASMAEKLNKSIQCPDCGSFDLETVFNAPPGYIKSAILECPNKSPACAGCVHAG